MLDPLILVAEKIHYPIYNTYGANWEILNYLLESYDLSGQKLSLKVKHDYSYSSPISIGGHGPTV